MDKRFLLVILILLFVPGLGCMNRTVSNKVSRSTALTLQNSTCPLQSLTGTHDRFAFALKQSIDYFQEHSGQEFAFGPKVYSGTALTVAYTKLLEKIQHSQNISTPEIVNYLCSEFLFFRPAVDYVRFTGYFEPVLKGALQRDEQFSFPVYALPAEYSNTARGKSTPEQLTRAQIDYQQKLSGRNLEIAWVSDQIDLFFLHVQGSGKIELPDGSTIRVGYAGNNGKSYRAIGNLLLDERKISKASMSMQSIKQYLRAHPEEQEHILSYNPRYIFFKILPDSHGPFGSLGKVLTPYHSIATDSDLFPAGALSLASLTLPHPQESRKESFLVLNQDTGAAIKTNGRADLFVGSGSANEYVAGHLNAPGDLYFLAPINN